MPRYRSAVVLACLALVAGCTSSLDRVETLDDVALAEGVQVADLGGSPEADQEPVFRRGVFGDLLGRGEGRAPGAGARGTMAEAVDAAVKGTSGEKEAAADVPSEEPSSDSAVADATTLDTAPQKRAGLFSGLFGGVARSTETTPEQQPSEADVPETQVAALEPAPEPIAQPRRGFFGALRTAPRASASSEPDVPAGAELGFGQVGRVCGMAKRDMGREVERFPQGARRGGYALYDSAIGSTAQRAFYVTGFSDGCARMVTAANAVFGAPSMHEALRYGLPADTVPSSRTDEAYKTLKSRICRVGRNAPCGKRIDRLEANTVFLTVYGSFSNNTRWSNLLLHDGAIYATDIKQGR